MWCVWCGAQCVFVVYVVCGCSVCVCVCACVVCACGVCPDLCIWCVQLAPNWQQELTEALDVLLQFSQPVPLLLVQELLDTAVHGGLVEETKPEQLAFGREGGRGGRGGREGREERERGEGGKGERGGGKGRNGEDGGMRREGKEWEKRAGGCGGNEGRKGENFPV